MKKERELKPRLRFPEFRDEGGWRQEFLGNLSSMQAGSFVAASMIGESYQDDLYPCYGGNGLRGFTKTYTHEGAYSLIGRQGALCGNITFASGRFHATEHAIVVDPKSCIHSDWLYHTLIFLDLNKYATGQAQPGLAVKNLEQLSVCVPKAWEEQKKLALCLTSINDLIADQTRKLEKITNCKKALLQQLFPAEGETVPKLRFHEFRRAGKWKSKKIGDVLDEIERPIEMQNEAEYSLVTVKRRYGGVVFRERLEGRSIKVKSQFLVCKDDFLISKRQIVHNACGIVPEELAGSIVSNEYAVFLPREECNIHFFNYFVQQPAVSQSFLASSVGIVIEKMLFKTDVWLRQRFCFPSVEEQRRIAETLTSLDNLITLHTQKLDLLKAHKKGLMQQIFPAPKEVAR